MRYALEAARETIHVSLEFRLHGLHDGDTGKNDAEVGFQASPEGVEASEIIEVGFSCRFIHGSYAEGRNDAGAGRSVSQLWMRV